MYHYLQSLNHRLLNNLLSCLVHYLFFASLLYGCNVKNSSNMPEAGYTFFTPIDDRENQVNNLLGNDPNFSQENSESVHPRVQRAYDQENSVVHQVSNSLIMKILKKII